MCKTQFKSAIKSYPKQIYLPQISNDNGHPFPTHTSHCMPNFQHHSLTPGNQLQLAAHTQTVSNINVTFSRLHQINSVYTQ